VVERETARHGLSWESMATIERFAILVCLNWWASARLQG
jgi:hypothetical protein